jgi:general secretion pathway protein A
MYEEFYGLEKRPFSTVPDTKFLYRSKEHSEAWNHLLYGISAKEGFMLITGDVGTGKTILCRALLYELNEKMETALIFNPPATPLELIQTILQDLGLNASGTSKKELIDTLNAYLLKCANDAKGVVVIIDESQDLPEEVLEEIRLLSNLETEEEKLLHIILVGQTELLEKLSTNSMRQLYQRISTHYDIKPLKEDEVASYIQYRLLKAGSNGDIIFSRYAVKKIYRCSLGIPRMINLICDKALLAGYVAQKKKITVGMVNEALKTTYRSQVVLSQAVLRLSYGVLGCVILGLIIVGYFMGSWERLILHDKHKPVSSHVAVKIPDSLPPKHVYKDEQKIIYPDKNTVNIQLPPDNEKEFINAAFDSNGVMRTNINFVCAREVLATILRLWGVSEETLIEEIARWRDESTFSFYDHSTPFDLLVTTMETSIEQIKALNYPCITPVTTDRYRFTVLSGINGDRVTVLDPRDGKRTLPIKEFQRMWKGKAFCVWRDFDMLPKNLKMGDVMQEVITIKKRFKTLGFEFATPLTEIYDEELDNAIKDFQTRFGIEADGIFNSRTKMAVYRALYNSKLPALQF